MTLLPLGALRYVDPPVTAYMAGARVAAWRRGDDQFHLDYRPRPLEAMSPWVALAVITAEDQRFAYHRGFDTAAIRAAWAHYQAGGRLRGASTLSQQVARNLFLWPGRSWLRKALEAWLTVWLEICLSKTRILELHLNIAEYGPGVYGVAAASARYFGRDVSTLDAGQAALLASALPNPRHYRLAEPVEAMRRRQAWIQAQMRQLGGLGYLEALH